MNTLHLLCTLLLLHRLHLRSSDIRSQRLGTQVSMTCTPCPALRACEPLPQEERLSLSPFHRRVRAPRGHVAPEGEAPPGRGANSLAAEPMPLPAGVSQPRIPEAPQALVSDGPPSPPQLSSLCQLLGLMRPSSLKRYRSPETVLPGQEQQPKASAQLDHKVSTQPLPTSSGAPSQGWQGCPHGTASPKPCRTGPSPPAAPTASAEPVPGPLTEVACCGHRHAGWWVLLRPLQPGVALVERTRELNCW